MVDAAVAVLVLSAPHSLELLGDASALAKRLSGRVVGWCLPGFPAEAELARHGCDELVRLKHERLARWASEAVAEACAQAMPKGCRAVILPATSRCEEVAALLAVKLGAAWIPGALSLSATRAGTVEVTATLPCGKLSRVYRASGEAPLVVTVREGVAEIRNDPRALVGTDFTPDLSSIKELTRVTATLPADPRMLDIRHARRIVAGGRGTGGPDGMHLVERLSDSLGASLAASRVAVDLGWAAPERQVGQTGRTVRPDLYVACGISGASHHVAGMRESRHIVAINPDSAAPIHEVAHLSLHADLRALIPEVESVLKRRRGNA